MTHRVVRDWRALLLAGLVAVSLGSATKVANAATPGRPLTSDSDCLRSALTAVDPAVRKNALQAIAILRRREFSSQVLRSLWDPSEEVRIAAADATGALGISNPDSLLLAFSDWSPAVRAAASEIVSLPMAPGVESLNVAVAAGVLLYALGR